jgi:hypothetical protein
MSSFKSCQPDGVYALVKARFRGPKLPVASLMHPKPSKTARSGGPDSALGMQSSQPRIARQAGPATAIRDPGQAGVDVRRRPSASARRSSVAAVGLPAPRSKRLISALLYERPPHHGPDKA